MSVLELGEVSVLERCLIEEMSVLERCLYWRDFGIRKVTVLEVSVLERCI